MKLYSRERKRNKETDKERYEERYNDVITYISIFQQDVGDV